MTTEELFREWQKVLRLEDWKLQYAVRSGDEMDGNHGDAIVHQRKQCAFIRLLEPADAGRDEEIEPYDQEVAIVHEQLHVRLWPFISDQGTFENDTQEQAVHVLSTILVAMKRRVRELEAQAKRKRRAQ